MTTRLRTLNPDDKGADFVALNDAIKAWLLAERVKFVIRYVVPSNFTSIGKDYRAWETDWYAEHGICPVSNFERSHDDATRYTDDYAKGREFGKAARDTTAEFGFPVSAPIFCSVDQDIRGYNIDEAERYVRGFTEAIAPYPIGIYGDDDIAYRCRDLNPVYWRANARAWDNETRDVMVHVQQSLPIPPGVDPNTVVSPFTVWDPGASTQPTKPDVPEVIIPPTTPEVPDMTVKTLWCRAATDASDPVYCIEDGVQISATVRKAWRADPNVHVIEIFGDEHPGILASLEHKAAGQPVVAEFPTSFKVPGYTIKAG